MKGRNKWVFSVAVFILAAGCKKKCEENISFLPEDFYRAYENVETLVYEVRDTIWPFNADTFTMVKSYDRDDFVKLEYADECLSYKQAHVVGFRSLDGLMDFDHFLAMPSSEEELHQFGMNLRIKHSYLWFHGTDYNPSGKTLPDTFQLHDGGVIKFTPDSGFVAASYWTRVVKRLR